MLRRTAVSCRHRIGFVVTYPVRRVNRPRRLFGPFAMRHTTTAPVQRTDRFQPLRLTGPFDPVPPPPTTMTTTSFGAWRQVLSVRPPVSYNIRTFINNNNIYIFTAPHSIQSLYIVNSIKVCTHEVGTIYNT